MRQKLKLAQWKPNALLSNPLVKSEWETFEGETELKEHFLRIKMIWHFVDWEGWREEDERDNSRVWEDNLQT